MQVWAGQEDETFLHPKSPQAGVQGGYKKDIPIGTHSLYLAPCPWKECGGPGVPIGCLLKHYTFTDDDKKYAKGPIIAWNSACPHPSTKRKHAPAEQKLNRQPRKFL